MTPTLAPPRLFDVDAEGFEGPAVRDIDHEGLLESAPAGIAPEYLDEAIQAITPAYTMYFPVSLWA